MIRKMRIILLGVTPIKYPDLPLAFVRSGYVRPDNGILTATGYEGGNWSRSSGASASVARHLTLSAQGIITSNSNGRLFGFPLSCLYPGSA